jgi:predicted ribosome quality control (RQC) complex YloA/Tae2 family protein
MLTSIVLLSRRLKPTTRLYTIDHARAVSICNGAMRHQPATYDPHMNITLLERLIHEIRDDLVGRSLGTPSWVPPVLAIPVGGVGVHLVAILESPGPFCFLTDASPFGAARAPARFAKINGAKIRDVALHDGDRILRIDALTRGEREALSLHVRLFGSAGSAALYTDDTIGETVGAVRVDAEGAPRAHHERPAWPSAPVVLSTRGRLALAAPVPAAGVTPGEGVFGPFADARAACQHVGGRILDAAHAAILHRIARPARRKLDGMHKLAANLELDLERSREHAGVRREAETLAAFQSRVPTGSAGVTLPDVYDPRLEVFIELDPTESVHVQVEKRFRRAAKLEKSAAHAQRRLELVRREITELEAALAVLEAADTFEASLRTFEALRARFGIELEGPRVTTGAGARRTASEKNYRQFDLDPHWFAIVGRSNHENDEITFKVAGPGDYWFHAQGVAGSHVVLKSRGGSDGPPARIIQRAASLAAHFSKARHSSLAPVIYTQKKYVRRFRGAKPGQVTCERETMVMVPPTLPGPPTDSR